MGEGERGREGERKWREGGKEKDVWRLRWGLVEFLQRDVYFLSCEVIARSLEAVRRASPLARTLALQPRHSDSLLSTHR
ncbi:hypothetical protein E2C01_074945 [Portunus trituberculatus]|uniref:Uncharacterized protein n=1 Tax=Portunus trituberculatus TaxID=210409 RepID=A0A5B7IFL8_PORTR|nr:hypothetical protein [Portunus trituberculatus]